MNFIKKNKALIIILIFGIAGFLIWWFFFKAPTAEELANLAVKKDFEKTNKLDKLNDPFFEEVKRWYMEANQGLHFSSILGKGIKNMNEKERLEAWKKLKSS
jgi:hypothetical protein